MEQTIDSEITDQNDLLHNHSCISVMTANVCGQNKYGFSLRKEAAFEVFKQEFDKCKAELVGFQEFARNNWEVFGKARPDLELVLGKELEDLSLNAFAYTKERFKLIEHDTIWLTPDRTCDKGWDDIFERGMTWAIMEDLENNYQFLFINTHFDNVGKIARQESVRILLDEAYRYGLPTLVTADSNISVHSSYRELWSKRALREPYDKMINAGFKDAWLEAHPGEVRPSTFHNHRGSRYSALRHDNFGTADTEWIMYRGPWRTAEAWIITDRYKGVYPSDHFWMQALLVWDS